MPLLIRPHERGGHFTRTGAGDAIAGRGPFSRTHFLPLYIFEPRYREMLAHALAHERMFCVALLRPETAQWKSEDDFFDVGTIGLIRACVGRGNGTSNLILQGLQRVCFADFVQLHPFPIAELETLRSDNETTVKTDALGAKVLELYARFKTLGRQLPTKIDRYVTDMTDLAMLANLMASTFIDDRCAVNKCWKNWT